MRVFRNKFLFFILAGGFLLMLMLPFRSSYLRFMNKSHEYYSELARACESVLLAHPLGTNEFIRIQARDSSVPRIIQNLHPERVTVSPNRVHILVGVGRGGFGIAWEPQDARHWRITTYAESLERVAAVGTR